MSTRAVRDKLLKFVRALFQRIRENTTIDLRALALTRIAFGALVITDVTNRSADLVAHYSDAGWLPREQAGDPVLLRAYYMSGDPDVVAAVMIVSCIAGVTLSLGVFSRVSAIVCWFLLGSLHHRVWVVNQGGDDLIRNMLFFLAFTPLGARWSIDAWLRRRKVDKPPDTVSDLTSIVLVGQLFLVYFIAGSMKANHAHWWQGEAVYHALSANHFVTELGQWIYPHWYVLKALTWSSLALELLGPFVLVFGPPKARVRGPLVIAFVLFHAGIAATLHVGIFSAISCACWLFTLPTAWMDALAKRLRLSPAGDTTLVGPLPLRVLGAVVFSYLVFATVIEDRAPKEAAYRQQVQWPMKALGLKRRWALFVSPRRVRGWVVLQGHLFEGPDVDFVRQRAPLTFDPPENFYRVFDNQRWRKMLMRFRSKKHAHLARAYLEYLCRKHDDVSSLRFFFMEQPMGKRYDHGPVKKTLRATVSCRSVRLNDKRQGTEPAGSRPATTSDR